MMEHGTDQMQSESIAFSFPFCLFLLRKTDISLCRFIETDPNRLITFLQVSENGITTEGIDRKAYPIF